MCIQRRAPKNEKNYNHINHNIDWKIKLKLSEGCDVWLIRTSEFQLKLSCGILYGYILFAKHKLSIYVCMLAKLLRLKLAARFSRTCKDYSLTARCLTQNSHRYIDTWYERHLAAKLSSSKVRELHATTGSVGLGSVRKISNCSICWHSL